MAFAFLVYPGDAEGVVMADWVDGEAAVNRIQSIVDGHFEIVWHPRGVEAPYTAVQNEEGVLIRMQKNWMARHLLSRLGYEMRRTVPLGPVIVLGQNFKPLTQAQLATVKETFEQVVDEFSVDLWIQAAGDAVEDAVNVGMTRATLAFSDFSPPLTRERAPELIAELQKQQFKAYVEEDESDPDHPSLAIEIVVQK